MISIFSLQAATSLENARLYDESLRQLEEMEALTEIGREISSTLDLTTVFDRILAASLVGTNGFILLIVIGFIYGRIDMFIDIAITYALLNFVVAIVLAKYFERKGARSE